MCFLINVILGMNMVLANHLMEMLWCYIENSPDYRHEK